MKFSHKTPHLKGKQHQLDPNLDLKQLVHHATVQYVDRDADGDVDVFDNPKKKTPDENPTGMNVGDLSKKLIAKQKGELKHTRRGMAYEDLRNWFSKSHPEGNWKRYNTKGEAIGPCAREDGEAKPKCLSNEKAAKMSKDEIAASVRRKREKDPVADRKGKGGKPIMSSNKIDEGLLDRLRGRRVVGRTGSGGKVYAPTKPKKSTVTYGGKTADQIRQDNNQKKVDTKRKEKVKSGQYDDPWLRSAPAAERRVHLQQLRGEAMEEKRYCIKCKKMETRDECSYGPEMWDKMTIKNFSEAAKRDHEYSMARSQLATVMDAAKRLRKKMAKGEGEVEAWVQSKITKAADYLDAAADYIDSGESKVNEDVTIEDANGNTFLQIIDIIKADRLVKEGISFDVGKPSRGAGALTPSAAAQLGPKAVELQKKKAASVSLPSTAGVKLADSYKLKSFDEFMSEASPAWQRKEGKNPEGGLNKKGIASYRKENPGSNLSLAVTTKPSELKKGSKSANRRKSFCSRMSGMKKKLTSAKTANDPDSRINKSLRKWNC